MNDSTFKLPSLLAFPLILSLLIGVSLACAIPGTTQSTPTPPAATQPVLPASTAAPPAPPTPTSQPLPPALVESSPGQRGKVPLGGPVRLYFNQAMDRKSVEAAVSGFSGRFQWADDSTLTFTPDKPFVPDTQVSLTIGESARAANGLELPGPVELVFQTAGVLRLTQRLPEANARAVDPTAAVVASFNRPVVSLGDVSEELPPAFTLEPAVEGRGEWLNTSTYIFYPEPALAGGIRYTILPNPDLTSTDGSELEEAEAWVFTTAIPRLISIEPENEDGTVRLDTDILLTFNQPMDPQSVEANFQLLDQENAVVAGEFTWNEDLTILTFNPRPMLRRAQVYTAELEGRALSLGGTALGTEARSQLETIPALAVIGSEPSQGGEQPVYSSAVIYFNAPIQSRDVLQFITFSPEVPNLDFYLDEGDRTLRLFGNFAPQTEYSLIVSPNLPDAWNGRLGQEFILNFRTLPLDPALVVSFGLDTLFLTPEDARLTVQVTNLPRIAYSLGRLSLEDFKELSKPEGYEARLAFQPEEPEEFVQNLEVPANRSTAVDLPLTVDGSPLDPGLYFLRFKMAGDRIFSGPYLLVVGNVNLMLKISASDALAWAVDLQTGEAVAGAPVAIYDENGQVIAEGETDLEGIFQNSIPVQQDPYPTRYAVLGQPGDEFFGVALTSWIQDMHSFSRIFADLRPPRLEAYLYTDRPIYRPGQTVYFRAVARQVYNGRYSLPDRDSLPIAVVDEMAQEITAFDLPLSSFGTAHGEYTLPEDLAPGYYRLESEEAGYSSVSFQVAEYRKPEINLQVHFDAEQVLAGEPFEAVVEARYFFDAPAGNVPVRWTLSRQRTFFTLEGYVVGPQDDGWLGPTQGPIFQFGELVAEGEGTTGPDGRLALDLETDLADGRQIYTLEVTVQDESGLPVSAREQIPANPAEFYIGVRPDAWVGREGRETGFEVQVVDWEENSAGERSMRAVFEKVVWERQEADPNEPFGFPVYTPRYTLVGSADFQTAPDGMARLAFTPPEAGTYQLDIRSLEPGSEGAHTQLLLWAGGEGDAVWPDLPNQNLQLTADREIYLPGQTAQVFIPNPFGDGAHALVTVERGVVLRYEVVRVDGAGENFSLPLGEEDAPNVYLSVTLLKAADGGPADFRHGVINIPVLPVSQTLNVELTSQPERAGPGAPVSFEVLVTDSDGNPVEGEFSFAVVDTAALALAAPNSEDIASAFYGTQGLGVRTGLALAAYTRRSTDFLGGEGGGGGGDFQAPPTIREEFLDTAFWEAGIVTDEEGMARVEMNLPDNLTTWQVEVRGLTADTRVGQSTIQVIATKDLLVRPVTPRFLVLGDHALMAAVVQNNSGEDLEVEVALQATGFALDDPGQAAQQVRLAAGERARVEWWGTAQDVASVELIFSAAGGDFEDAARPAMGALPVLRYTAPQTFGTSGVLDSEGEHLELVSLPRSFDPSGGNLKVELAPSLGAAMVSALEALEHFPYEFTEQTVSRFLPNLQTFQVLKEFGLSTPALQTRLERTLGEGLAKLVASQNDDGGWGWWPGGESHPYISAYALFGLARAREAGISVDAQTYSGAVSYLDAARLDLEDLEENWQFDRLAFELYVLAISGEGDLEVTEALYGQHERLNPWGLAFLLRTFEVLAPGDERIKTLLSDLQAAALRSATGAHWEEAERDFRNLSSPIFTTAVVLDTLARTDPASPLVADALRYLIAHRNASGGWASSYETAWTLMALTRVMQGTGELAGEFDFSATLNGAPLASGAAGGNAQLNPVVAGVPVSELDPDSPNALLIQREGGPGRLYYTAHLTVNRPVEDIPPLDQGLTISRTYTEGAPCGVGGCEPVREAKAGDLVKVRLSLSLSETAYYLLVEDYIPAGAEVLDVRLVTSQQEIPDYDPRRPFDEGWGWWFFRDPQVYDDHIAWAVDSLPPGTYELTYTLVILQPGGYRVLPARAWQFYFPELQGNSAGDVFVIEP
jgi:alpha-2-macroglobulin